MTGLPAIVQVVLLGAPVQVSATAWLNPAIGVTVTLNIWLEPRETVTAAGAVTVKSAATFVPVPVNVADCGLLGSASLNTSDADSAAATEGVNVTITVQDAPTARIAGQGLLEIAKSVPAAGGAVATIVMLLIVSGDKLLLVIVTDCGFDLTPTACVPNATVAGEMTTGSKSGSFAT